jgi:pimeloyl-ACP methyl ester carboxylesterase
MTRPSPGPYDPAWEHRTAPGADGNSVHYVTAADAESTVVLLHGWPGFWFDWRRVIPLLAEHCRVIAIDFRGFGDSPLPAGDPAGVSGEANLGRDVIAVMDHLGIDNAHFGAFDIGAAVAEWVARRHPDRVDSLVLTNPTHPGIGSRRDPVTLSGEFWYQQFHLLPWSADVIGRDRESLKIYLSHFYRHWSATADAMHPDDLDAIVDVYARPGAFDASIAWYRARVRERAEQAKADQDSLIIRHTTTVLWTDRDPVCPPEWADGIERYFTALTLHHVFGVGHFMAWEQPQPFVDAVLALAAPQRDRRS